MPILELVNSKINSLYSKGKIYKVTFGDKSIYVGSTCKDIDTRLKWHLSNKNSQIYKHKDKKTKIELIIEAPSIDKKSLEKVENEYIAEYAEKFGNKLLTKDVIQ